MISEKNYFPVDIFAVKKYGVEKWQNEFFWPVSDQEFGNLARDIRECLIKHINAQPKEIKDLLIIQRTLFFEYLHFLHALKVIDKIKEKEILYSKNSLWYSDIVNNTFTGSDFLKKVKQKTLKKTEIEIKNFLKCLIYNIKFNKFFKFTKKAGLLYVYGSIRPLMEEYIKKVPCLIRFTSRRDWLLENTFYKLPEDIKSKIKDFSKTLVDEVKVIADRNGITLYNNYLAHLRELTKEVLSDAGKMLDLARATVDTKREVNLLVSAIGDTFSRALYVAAREKGGKIVSFSHGGNIGLYNTSTMSFSEFMFSDEFVTYTEESTKLFEKIKSDHPSFNNKVNITSCDSNQFFKTWQWHGNKPLPKYIKRVMVIGYPHSQWRKYHASASLSLMQLDLELRIVNLLKKSGYDVLYKVHPDRISEVEGIFENNARVLKGYFQNYLDMTDAFLFGSVRTTAFPIALCTNKPIIAFRMEDEPHKPFSGAMELLQKRCSIIHSKFDERNRIIFDEEELLDILAKEPEHPNNEFIKTYMFPKSVKV